MFSVVELGQHSLPSNPARTQGQSRWHATPLAALLGVIEKSPARYAEL
jgi:hypothetical protein